MRTLYPTAVVSISATLVASLFASLPGVVIGLSIFNFMCIVGLAVSFPALGAFGPAVGRVLGARGKVALTFDDGPHPIHTRRVLDALDAAGARATFFVIAEHVDRHPDLAREIARRGHEIALHSLRHDPVLSIKGIAAIRRDFEESEEVFARVLGSRPTFFRPPAGVASPRIHTVARQKGYVIVGWSLRGLDGIGSATAGAVRARVGRRAHAGDVILLHDALRSREAQAPAGVEALPEILADLRLKGLAATTVSDLLRG